MLEAWRTFIGLNASNPFVEERAYRSKERVLMSAATGFDEPFQPGLLRGIGNVTPAAVKKHDLVFGNIPGLQIVEIAGERQVEVTGFPADRRDGSEKAVPIMPASTDHKHLDSRAMCGVRFRSLQVHRGAG